MDRRLFLLTGLACVASSGHAAMEVFEISYTDAEWRTRLTEAEYQVMRRERTERAGSSPLASTHAPGIYQCKGCGLPLYSSAAKFDSGTGWPSFFESLPDSIATKPDNTFFVTRTEAHCRRCGCHLGHIFDDGPQPTGMRHCLNGISLIFVSA